MIGLALWLSILVGASALATSLVSGLGLSLARSLLERVEPRARARAFAFAALLPLVVAGLVLGAVLLPHPWLGLPEHCVHHDDDHLHLCFAHGAPTPSLAVIVLAGALCLRIAGGLMLETWRAVRASVALRRVRAASADSRRERLSNARQPLAREAGLGEGARRSRAGGVFQDPSEIELVRLPIEAPLAFTAGWLRPQVFASMAVVDAPEWRIVIAHERDHARHRDPLVRLVARLAAALHAPGIARWIVRELASAQELAADEHAARVIGDRLAVAEQILAFARDAARGPSVVAAFAEGDVARRVGALLETPRYVRGPSFVHVLVLVATSGAATVLASTWIHHELEALLALFAS